MKRRLLCGSMILVMLTVCTGCTAGLGKIPTVEAETLDDTTPAEAVSEKTEETSQMETQVEESVTSQEPEETALEAEEEAEDGWQRLTLEDLPEYANSDVFGAAEEEEYVPEEQAKEEQSPEGYTFVFVDTYLYETEQSGWTIGAETPEEEGPAEAEIDPTRPTEAELTPGEAVDQAARILEQTTGLTPASGWNVEYWPSLAFDEKDYLSGRAQYAIRNDDDAHFLVYLDSITGDWQLIMPGEEGLRGETILQLIAWGEGKGKDVAPLKAYLEEGRAFAGSRGSEAVVTRTMEAMGMQLKNVQQLDMRILLPRDGDEDWTSYMEEMAREDDFDMYSYLSGVVEVSVTTENDEQFLVRFDTVSREIQQITRGLPDPEDHIEIAMEDGA